MEKEIETHTLKKHKEIYKDRRRKTYILNGFSDEGIAYTPGIFCFLKWLLWKIKENDNI